MKSDKNPHAVALGKLGGQQRTKAKIEAARLNGKKGGRPKVMKCYRLGCDKKGTEKYKDKKSLCWLDPVCKEHQYHE